jgi:hypothetical protein
MTVRPLCGFCGYTVEQCQCNYEREEMKTTQKALSAEEMQKLTALLNEIWKLGDKDEMSIKHIGHGLAALVAFGDWQKGIDYNLPRERMTKPKLNLLISYWLNVAELLEELTRAECVAVFESLDIAWYGAAYLDWPDYAESAGN